MGSGELGDQRYDLIVSNPPYHEGKGETERVLEELASGAPAHLTEGGMLLLVTQRRLPGSTPPGGGIRHRRGDPR